MSEINSKKLNFILESTKAHKHNGKTFFDHLLQTSGIVEKLCQKIGIEEYQYLVDAALFHSIYGTDYYEFNEQITREKVISLIGEQAEQLVHFFCSLPERNIQILQHKFDKRLQRDLYIIEYANLLELSITDVQRTSALNPAKIFRLKLLRANLIDHYKFEMPDLPFDFQTK
tara:strand:- start:154 stop:669 length:516 start_codon:yes stop_codon:yes gene_type:complete